MGLGLTFLLPAVTFAQSTDVQFVLLYITQKKTLPVIQPQSVSVLDPQFVAARIDEAGRLELTALAMGQTYVFVWTATGKTVVHVRVEYPPSAFRRATIPLPQPRRGASFGTYSATLTTAQNEAGLSEPFLEQSVYYTAPVGPYTLTGTTTLLNRLGGEGTSGTVGNDWLRVRETFFHLESKHWGFTLLDAGVNNGLTSLSYVTLRGAHVQYRGSGKTITLFSGIVPQGLSLVGTNPGVAAGANLSYRLRPGVQLRSSFTFLQRSTSLYDRSKGVIANLGADYFPTDNLKLEGEVGLSSTGSAQGVGLRYHRKKTELDARYTHFPRHYPLVFLQMLPGGQETTYVSLRHSFSPRLQVSSVLSDGKTTSITRFSDAFSHNRYATVSATFAPNVKNQLALTYTRTATDSQVFRSVFALGSTRDQSINNNYQLSYGRRLSPLWNNTAQFGWNQNYDPTLVNRFHGWQFTNETRKNFSQSNSNLTFRFDYSRQVPSLAQFLRLNPTLLPPSLFAEFVSDPLFFVHYDAVLRVLFPPSLITNQRSLGMQVMAQHTRARWTLAETFSFVDQRNFGPGQRFFNPAVQLQYRLRDRDVLLVTDNFVQNTASGSGPTPGRRLNVLSVGLTHYFGSSAQGSSVFSGLLRGRLRGEAYLDYNRNSQRDAGEPGIADLEVVLNDGRRARTDVDGQFLLAGLVPGVYVVHVEGDGVGKTVRLLSAPQRAVEIKSRRETSVQFAATNTALLTGRVFNDFKEKGRSDAETPGIPGVLYTLEGMGASEKATSGPDGLFQFPGLVPGAYTLELDANSLPPGFEIPAELTTRVTLEPLQNAYLEQPMRAQRTLSGIVYFDANLNRLFDNNDPVVPFAEIEVDGQQLRAGATGRFIARRLKPGEYSLTARGKLKVNGSEKTLTGVTRLTVVIEPIHVEELEIPVYENNGSNGAPNGNSH